MVFFNDNLHPTGLSLNSCFQYLNWAEPGNSLNPCNSNTVFFTWYEILESPEVADMQTYFGIKSFHTSESHKTPDQTWK